MESQVPSFSWEWSSSIYLYHMETHTKKKMWRKLPILWALSQQYTLIWWDGKKCRQQDTFLPLLLTDCYSRWEKSACNEFWLNPYWVDWLDSGDQETKKILNHIVVRKYCFLDIAASGMVFFSLRTESRKKGGK